MDLESAQQGGPRETVLLLGAGGTQSSDAVGNRQTGQPGRTHSAHVRDRTHHCLKGQVPGLGETRQKLLGQLPIELGASHGDLRQGRHHALGNSREVGERAKHSRRRRGILQQVAGPCQVLGHPWPGDLGLTGPQGPVPGDHSHRLGRMPRPDQCVGDEARIGVPRQTFLQAAAGDAPADTLVRYVQGAAQLVEHRSAILRHGTHRGNHDRRSVARLRSSSLFHLLHDFLTRVVGRALKPGSDRHTRIVPFPCSVERGNNDAFF